MARLSREEKLSYLLDEIMVVFDLYKKDDTYNCIQDALKEIANTIKKDNLDGTHNYPVTVSLYRYLKKQNYLDSTIKDKTT